MRWRGRLESLADMELGIINVTNVSSHDIQQRHDKPFKPNIGQIKTIKIPKIKISKQRIFFLSSRFRVFTDLVAQL